MSEGEGLSLEVARDWTFETADIARSFDRHVREQLPWYDLATGAVAHIIRHYLPRGGVMYDIGASTGNIGRAVAGILSDRCARVIPVEASEEMARVYTGPGREALVCGDIAQVEIEPFDVAVLFLTMMFIVPGERVGVVARLRARLRPGGVIIILDKATAQGGYLGTMLARLTLAGKVASGVPAGDIVAKELSLAGVQRPVSPREVAGWGGTEWFRFGEFVGWVIEGE